MGVIRDTANQIFRNFETPDVPTTGVHKPTKTDIRGLFGTVEDIIAQTIQAELVDVSYATVEDMDAEADTQPIGTRALVYADPDPEKRDIYVLEENSGSGSADWQPTSLLHDVIASIIQPYVDQVDSAADELVAAAGAISSQTVGKPTAIAAGALSWTPGTIIWPTAVTIDGVWSTVDFQSPAAQAVVFGVYSLDGSNHAVLLRSASVQVATGANLGVAVGLEVNPGEYLGWHAPSHERYTSPGTAGIVMKFSFPVIDGTGGAMSNSSAITVEFRAYLEGSILAAANKGAAIYDEVEPGLQQYSLGRNDVSNTGTIWIDSPIIYPTPIAIDGYWSFMDIGAPAAASVICTVYDRISAGEFDPVRATIVHVPAGGDLQVPVGLEVSAGQYIGFQSSAFARYTAGGLPVYFYTGSTLRTSSNILLQFAAYIEGWLVGGINAALAGAGGGGGGGGFTTQWQGKKWAALGTSITAQTYYTTPLAALLGLTLTNLGAGGACLAACPPFYGSRVIYDAIASVPVDSQLVTLECGINDFAAGNSPLGARGDTTVATYYGALWAAFVAIKARAPNALIVAIMTYGGGAGAPNNSEVTHVNTNGNRLWQFQEAMAQVSADMGIPLCDVGRRSSIGYLTAGTYTSDQLHLNTAGGVVHSNFDAWFLTDLANQGLVPA